MEQRKLAVDLAEVIVKWECQRMKEESEDVVPQVTNGERLVLCDYFISNQIVFTVLKSYH